MEIMGYRHCNYHFIYQFTMPPMPVFNVQVVDTPKEH